MLDLPGAAGETWVDERLAHAFSVTAPAAAREIVLRAAGYPGMPASTHWELEEGAVSFAGVEGGPADLARMIVAEFAMLAPALAAQQNGPPLESVSFVRDEEANLAWAIEERLETATGVRGRPLALPAAVARAAVLDPPSSRSRSAPKAPPRCACGARACWRGRSSTTRRLPGRRAACSPPNGPLRVREEEIPATGAQVTRRWQLARGADGRPHLWMARRKRPGRGERGSGLGFDAVDRG